MNTTLLAVALGGAVGSMGRYLLASSVTSLLGRGFPWGTFAVNIVGSFFMGILFQVFSERHPVLDLWRTGLMVGVLGGFTTFSSFSLESLQLIMQGAWRLAFVNALASVGLCLVGVWGGLSLARTL
ncbi:MAG: fluoride efflux transporter CrcB [Magnetococcales bacterium]|nr:fluoride efflux transporter CrcB [Magnetococcales bacterium]